jgi:multifunctional 2-oxoglutarate metabolism enzyme
MTEEARPGATKTDSTKTGDFGANDWLVEEMFEQYRRNPDSVSPSWQEFFADYGGRGNGRAPVTSGEAEAASVRPATEPARPEEPKAGETAAETTAPTAQPLRGAAARIVANMEASLAVPTATSARTVPAKLLEVNRRILNNYLARSRGGKVSFTHIIGYAVVQAVQSVPSMAAAYSEENGQPGVLRHPHIGLGIAVDMQKKDGSRNLLVPVIKEADTLDFAGFWAAYEELIRKVRTGKIGADDFGGVTMTLTNPGTIGTVHSVPRLMPGQGVIVGVGALDYPAEYQAADPRTLAELGVSKVLNLTSTYDHRIIQGAESGLFLQRIADLLMGKDAFYDEVFLSMGVPYEPVRWRRDVNPGSLEGEKARLAKQVHVQTLINMYRVRGHLIADLDPLTAKVPDMHPELDPATYGLTLWDLDREFFTDGLAGRDTMTLGEILGVLRDAYCRTVGIEYMHIQDPEQKAWIQKQIEGVGFDVSPDEHRHLLTRLNAAEAFERFLHTKYVGHKRFGLEGAESAIVVLDAVLDEAGNEGLSEVVIGMAHRGRLNVLANIVGKSYRELFREFEGDIDPGTREGSGDVKYHKGASGKFVGRSGKEITVTVASNPSHLEAVDPVVEGMVRAKQDLSGSKDYPVMPLLVHGDAAFAGQGVVAETLNLSLLRGYRTGGTVHLVINNQVGFTTAPESARSSEYATDVAKMVQAPIFHVNGDDPEACARVARLAFAFRQTFHKDVVIEMVCYRRFGHNEADEPSYTQPQMYARIERRRSVRKLYTEALVKRGDITMEEAEQALDDFSARLQTALDETRSSTTPQPTTLPTSAPVATVMPTVSTGVDREVLDRIVAALTEAPENFTVHPKLARQIEARAKLYAGGEVDWALAEAMAFGSLLLEGDDVRVAGQDTRRGTFSHRHAVLVDYRSGAEHVPLATLDEQQGNFWIYDSLLSEYAALGFEYGYSVVHKDALVAWEAQFGDFHNGAQIVIDQFIVAAEDKWNQTSGLVMLLPHGYEGQGPEHSSARIERFLTLCAEGNMQVVNATTAAQYFHVLRRQVRREIRKPLIVMTPKSKLRAKEAQSSIEELVTGTFREILDDATGDDPSTVQRVIVASGKVAYDAMAKRDQSGAPAVVVRVEQLYPFPGEQIAEAVGRYGNGRPEVVWLQEEPENMGAANFMRRRLADAIGRDVKVVARVESASPATGSAAMHALEQEDLLRRALS